MRTRFDRWRHAIGFELIGLILVVIGLNQILGADASHLGVMGLAFSIVATLWNYIYNIWFDKALLTLTGSVQKSIKIRVIHAIMFEAGLLIVTIPFIMWWMEMGFVEAIIMDLGLVVFYLIYAFVYNLAYDRLFPVPQKQSIA